MKKNKHTLLESIDQIRKTKHDAIARMIATCPDKSYRAIAEEMGCGISTVYLVARIRGIGRRKERQSAS